LLVAGLALHLSLHSKLLLRVFWGIWVRMQRQRLAVHCGVIAGIGCLAFLAYDSPVASIARIVVLSGGITWLIDRVGVRRQLLRFDLYAPLVRRVVSVGFYLTVTACVVWSMQHAPFIGHADYADNVVVARNLIRGRGWVVDYVTQFYQIYPSVTHPQETWPILQPVWIALSFVFFGVTDSAARVPNLVFWVLLAWLVGRFARHRWGMTVALVSVAFLSMNVFMYRQIIYATSDIAFVAFATAAFQGIWMLPQAEQTYWRNGWFRSFRAKSLATGVWTGLMLLQKPGSAAMLALGMGFWLLLTWVVPLFRAHMDWQALWRRLGYVIIWAGIACSVLMPYIVRNLILFGSAVHSTESYDAWILEYTQWDAIYRVYAADGGIGSGDLPERSWLLRWGFDALLHKFWMQGKVIQDYLLPSFVAFPWPFNAFGGAATATGMLSAFGLWCAVIGMLPPRTNKRVALWRMLLFCMLPYTIFMVTYWHANEPRYWVVLLPWLALAAGHGIVRVRDVLLRERQYPFFRGLLVSTAVVCALYSPVSSIRSSMLVDAALVVADRDLYQYLRTNTSPDAVMMTRVPWQLQWYSDRGAVMIPSDADATTILRIAKHYGARYLVLDSLQRPNAATRAVLTEMIAAPGSGFVLRYRTPAYPVDDRGRRFTMVSEVYEFPLDYQGVPPIW
ncbi:MAG: hypothetical protein RLY87_1287, partial [Chloroflexota bacterium]